MKRKYSLPYRTSEFVYIEKYGEQVIYYNLKKGEYIKIPLSVHEWITSDTKSEVKDNKILEYLYIVLEKLIDAEYIVPDFEKFEIGEDFVFVSKRNPGVIQENIYWGDLYVDETSIISHLYEKGYVTSKTRINYIYNEDMNISHFTLQGSIIIKNFSELSNIKAVSNQCIIIEADRIPTEDELNILKDNFNDCKIKIAISYGLEKSFVDEIIMMMEKINNVKVVYEICLMHRSAFSGVFAGVSQNAKHGLLNKLKISCGAGKNKFYIDKFGNIFPCYLMRDGNGIGNIFIDTPQAILDKQNKVISKLREKCNLCYVKYFCAGGCLARVKGDSYKACEVIRETLITQLQQQ